MSKEYEKFYGTIYRSGDSLVVTIPSKLAKFNGFNHGDAIKVMIKKHSVFEEE